jgi:hypothetical protein
MLRIVVSLLMAFSCSSAQAFTQEAVSCVQNQLNAAGYEAGEPDGLLGRKTRSALAAYQGDFGALSQRPLDLDHALIFCRLLGLNDPELKQYWPENSGELNVVFGELASSTEIADKLFVARMTSKLDLVHNKMKRLMNVELAAPINVLIGGSPKDIISLKQEREPRKIIGFNGTASQICQSTRNISATSLPNAIVFCRNGDAKIGTEIDASWLEFIIAHELVHAYQFQLSGAILATSDKTVLKHDGPQWLLEGSAQAIANHLTTGLPLSEYSTRMIAKLDGNVPKLTNVDDLSDLKSRRTEVYRAGVVVVAKLIPDEDYTKLGQFYEQLGKEEKWIAAFESVFGRDILGFQSGFGEAKQ